MITLTATKAKLTAANPDKDILTSGMASYVKCGFTFSADWDGLARTAVFTDGTVTRDVLLDDANECYVPHEVMTTAGRYIVVGVYGTDGATVIAPTLSAQLGAVYPGADPSGDPSVPPTPSVYDEIMADMLATRADNAAKLAAIEADNDATVLEISADNDATLLAIQQDNDATEAAIIADNAATALLTDADRTAAETAKNDALSAQASAEAAQGLSEAARDASVLAQGLSEDARDAALAAQSAAESAKDDAQMAVGKTSYVGANGNWYEWDAISDAFVDTGIAATAHISTAAEVLYISFATVNGETIRM